MHKAAGGAKPPVAGPSSGLRILESDHLLTAYAGSTSVAEDLGPTSSAGGAAKRPSLMGRAAAPRPKADFQASILEVLDDPRPLATLRRPGSRRLGRWWAFGGAAAALTLAVWMWAGHRPAAELAAAPPAAAAGTAVAASTPASAAAVLADATPAAAAAATPARIEDVAVPPAAAPTTAAPATAVPASEAVPAPPAERSAAAAAPAGTARPRPAAHAATRQNAAHRPAGGSSPATASAKAAARPAGNAARAPGNDPDVEILAALMSHLNANGGAAPPARSPDTIAELVRSCHALAPAEASACQRRICQGYWGKADACPARERHPTAD